MAPAKEDLPRRIALAHEWFTPRSTGGAELVVQAIDALLTAADRQPQLAALVDGESRRPGSWLERRSVLTSPIQRLPWGISHVQQYLPLQQLLQHDLQVPQQVHFSGNLYQQPHNSVLASFYDHLGFYDDFVQVMPSILCTSHFLFHHNPLVCTLL